jgi:hypothetical protein
MQELSQVSLLQPLQPLRARNEQPHPRNSARFHCHTTATPQGQEAAASKELSQVSLLNHCNPSWARNEEPHPRNSARFHC